MRSLIPRDNFFQDLFDFRRDFDQMFNRFLSWPLAQEEPTMTTAGFSPAIESFIDKEGNKFHCQVMLPGVDPKDVSLQVQGNTLTISGERSEKDKLNAEYRNGILEITAPIAAAALPRKVEIKALPSTAARHANA